MSEIENIQQEIFRTLEKRYNKDKDKIINWLSTDNIELSDVPPIFVMCKNTENARIVLNLLNEEL